MTTSPIEMKPPIAAATAAQEEQVIAVLLEAFSADPACRWAWPDSERFRTSFPEFVRALAGPAFGLGTAYTIGDGAGAALWLPPGVHSNEQALVALFERTVAGPDQETMFAVFEQMTSFHPAAPHWYLPLIGVKPSHQGQGYGAALLKHTLRACDRDGLPAYLESSNPRNISLYQQHGFEVVATIQDGTAPRISPMVRRPR